MKPTKIKINYSGINTMADLRNEQLRLKLHIKSQELELRSRVKQLPGELFYAGANAVIPSFLAGKVTSSVLNGGKELVNTLFSKNGHGDHKTKLLSSVKNAGLFTALRFAFKTFLGGK